MCDEEFATNSESLEHIIPNALGGHLKSNRLVCKKINNDLFAKLDAELCNSIEISNLIKFKRDRGNQLEIIGINSEGLKYAVNSDKIGKLLPMEPFEYLAEDGKKYKKFPLFQKKEIIASILKKNPDLEIETVEKRFHTSYEQKDEKLSYKNGLSIITSIDCFRAIAKIATNFFILNNGCKNQILNFIDFIKGGDLSKIKLGYFYPKTLLNYRFATNEISHILHLKGCNKEKLLYCYIELFNCHCFIVILSQTYLGNEFDETYIWDLQKAKKIDKELSLNISLNLLMNRSYLFYEGVEEDYAKRLFRINEILDLKISKE